MSVPDKERKYLTEEEFTRLLGVIKNARDTAIFTVCYWRALRASEVGRIPLSAWRRAQKRIYIVRLKGSLSGEYPISPGEHKALTAWLKERGEEPGPLFLTREGTGIGRKTLDDLMKRYGAEAGLPDHLRHMHALKHAIGTHLIAKGAGLYEVKDWLGHKDIRSTLVYAQLRNRERDAAAEKIYQQV